MIEYPLHLEPLSEAQTKWLSTKAVPPRALQEPTPILSAAGRRLKEGYFEPTPEGRKWLVFQEELDLVYWQPGTGEIASDTLRAFALGEENLQNPWATALDRYLNVFEDPLEWLRDSRRGIVIIKWKEAFDRLRDCPALAIPEALISKYKRFMRPPFLPRLAVRPTTYKEQVMA